MIRRLAILAVLLLLIAAFFAFDLQRMTSVAAIKEAHSQLVAYYEARPIQFIAAFMAIHVVMLTLCLPGAVLTMALAGGAIFGPALGTLIVLTSLTVGDSMGFLLSRTLIGSWVRELYVNQLYKVEQEADRNGAFYLLSLRLMAAVPYFVVNLMFGVTRMRLRTFAPVSFVGLAPATALYVNAGTELSKIESARDVLSPPLLVSFALLAILPIAARFLLRRGAALS